MIFDKHKTRPKKYRNTVYVTIKGSLFYLPLGIKQLSVCTSWIQALDKIKEKWSFGVFICIFSGDRGASCTKVYVPLTGRFQRLSNSSVHASLRQSLLFNVNFRLNNLFYTAVIKLVSSLFLYRILVNF